MFPSPSPPLSLFPQVVSDLMVAGQQPVVSAALTAADAATRTSIYRLLVATQTYEHIAMSAAVMDVSTAAAAQQQQQQRHHRGGDNSGGTVSAVVAAAVDYIVADALENLSDERSALAVSALKGPCAVLHCALWGCGGVGALCCVQLITAVQMITDAFAEEENTAVQLQIVKVCVCAQILNKKVGRGGRGKGGEVVCGCTCARACE